MNKRYVMQRLAKSMVASGVVLASTATSAQADEAVATRNNSAYVMADYYCDEIESDQSFDMIGGTLGYTHMLTSGDKLMFELTALTGSTGDVRTYSGIDYTDSNDDKTELRISLLYSMSSFKYFSFGVEYDYSSQKGESVYVDKSKHLVNRGTSSRPNWVWDGTYTSEKHPKEYTSDSSSSLMTKISANYPFVLYSGSSSSLYIKPRFDLSLGFSFGDGDTVGVYVCEGLTSLVYEIGSSCVILDCGYRYLSGFEGDYACQGVFARAGYSYCW